MDVMLWRRRAGGQGGEHYNACHVAFSGTAFNTASPCCAANVREPRKKAERHVSHTEVQLAAELLQSVSPPRRHSDPSNMGGFFSSLFSGLFGSREMRILILGLDGAGKTTILYRLQVGEVVTTIPST
ncbi:hypothetical protein CRUP_025283 [Coryphaenoides rupestris]|nr:hypothetical protein CRUP_025283 [Coryphaenoides rupestris]